MLRKGVKSFKQWCKENNKLEYLNLWDYDKNILAPSDVAASNGIDKFYFKCAKGKHNSFIKGINNLIHSKDLTCPECNSFYTWCVDNDRSDLISAWSSDNDDIHLISKSSAKKCKFIINDNCSYNMPVVYITGNKCFDPFKKYYNSFGYYLISKYGVHGIDMYWSDKNKLSPYDYDYGSSKKVYIKCNEKDYHDDYQIPCCSFSGKAQCRCPACASKIIHPKDSFAQFNIDRYGDDWIDKYWCDDNKLDPFLITAHDNKKKVHVRCQKVNYHTFWITPAGYNIRDFVCPCCKRKQLHSFDSFGYKHPEIIPLWSSKNSIDPYSIPEFYHELVWFKCENGIHEDYQRSPSHCFRNNHFEFKCIKCSIQNKISSYQKLVNNYFNNTNYTLLHEYDCSIIPTNPTTGYPLPLDNEVYELKLIIEVNGMQHYKVSGFHILSAQHNNSTPESEFEYIQWKDEFKKNYVLSQGYYYLSLPYYTFDSNEYITLIENKIVEIKNNTLLI